MSLLNRQKRAWWNVLALALCSMSAVMTTELAANVSDLPQLLIDNCGNKIAVWQVDQADVKIIQAASMDTTSSSWTSPLTISDNGLSSYNPHISMDWHGNVVAVWCVNEIENGIRRLAGALYTQATGTWSPVRLLSEAAHDVTSSYVIQVDGQTTGNSHFATLWQDFDATTSSFAIHSAEISFDTTSGTWSPWTTPSQVSASPVSEK